MSFRKKRWICLASAVLIEALLGVPYAWSVFQQPFIDKYGWTISQISTAYTSMYIFTMLITVLFGRKIRKALPIRKEIMLGGAIYAFALFGMSFIQKSYLELCFWWGIVYSIGTAFSYPVLISYSQELFPDKTGLAGGLVTAGYGVGSVVWAPMVTNLCQQLGDISGAFRVLGGIFLVGILALSLLLQDAPDGFREEILAEKAPTAGGKAANESVYDVNRSQMIRMPAMYIAIVSLLLALACGGMSVSQGSPIMVKRFGMSASAAALVVSMMSLANMGGRLLWGAVSDRLGKLKSLFMLHIMMLIAYVGLLVFRQQVLFVGALLMVLIAYGGASCLLAPVTAELFGSRNISENYTVTFCAFGLSSFVGPSLIANIRQSTGDYTLAFVCALAFSVVGSLLALYLWRLKIKRSKQTSEMI